MSFTHDFIINLEMNLKIEILKIVNSLYEFLLAISKFYLYSNFAFLLKLTNFLDNLIIEKLDDIFTF